MKRLLLIAALVAQPAFANEKASNATVFDHTKFVNTKVPITETHCYEVKAPVYGNVQKEGNAAGGALAGMIIGGLIGKGVTGKDNGAAAGAVIGGLIGADKGSQPKNSQEVVGHEWVQKCDEITTYQLVREEVYSHSTIRFYIDGKKYVVKFYK